MCVGIDMNEQGLLQKDCARVVMRSVSGTQSEAILMLRKLRDQLMRQTHRDDPSVLVS